LEDDHPDARNQTSDADEWDPDKHTKEDGSTDAYGELEFTGAGPSSRAKVSAFPNTIHWSVRETVLTANYILLAAFYASLKTIELSLLK